MATWKVAIGAVVLAAGVWIAARSTARDAASRHAEPAAPSIQRDVPSTTYVQAAPGFDADALRAIVREEIAAALTSKRDDHGVAPSAEKTEANIAAAEDGRALVTAGLDRGVWTAEDANRLLARLPEMTREDADALIAELFPAMNRGELKLDGVRTPLGPVIR